MFQFVASLLNGLYIRTTKKKDDGMGLGRCACSSVWGHITSLVAHLLYTRHSALNNGRQWRWRHCSCTWKAAVEQKMCMGRSAGQREVITFTTGGRQRRQRFAGPWSILLCRLYIYFYLFEKMLASSPCSHFLFFSIISSPLFFLCQCLLTEEQQQRARLLIRSHRLLLSPALLLLLLLPYHWCPFTISQLGHI